MAFVYRTRKETEMIIVRKGESIDTAINRFQKMYRDKLLDYRKHEFYRSKSEKRRAKRVLSLRRQSRKG